MHFTLKLMPVGDSLGIALPKEALAALKLGDGDALHLTRSSEGFQLAACDPALDEQMELGREFMRNFRDTFHALAK